MPGIFGFITNSKSENNDILLKSMQNSMFNKNYYSNTYKDQKIGIYFGWSGHKCLITKYLPKDIKNEVALILYGEIYSIDGINTNYTYQNLHSNSASDLIQLLKERGEKFLNILNGLFCGIIVDYRNNQCIIFNDRFGLQRLYYYQGNSHFFFSSEAKAILKILDEDKEIDFNSLGEYFKIGCAVQNRSLFKNIFLLPGGSLWKFKNGIIPKKILYFNPILYEEQKKLNKYEFYKSIKNVIATAFPRYFNSFSTLGISLTGGLDTRLIMASMNFPQQSVQCYTFGGMLRETFDVRFAKRIAHLCKQSHKVITLDNQFLENFSDYANRSVYISDGSLNVSSAYELYLNEKVKEIAQIKITGNYGSEILRGVNNLKLKCLDTNIFNADFIYYIKKAQKTYYDIRKDNRISFTLFKELPWSLYGRLSVEQSQLICRSPFLDNDLIKLIYQAPPGQIDSDDIAIKLIYDFMPDLLKIPTDNGFKSQTNIFLFMASKLYFWSLFKAEYYFNYGMPNWLLRLNSTALLKNTENIFIGRHKFHHYRIWYQNNLSEYIKSIILDKKTLERPYLKKVFLEKMLNEHFKGISNYTSEIDRILTIELTQRQLM